MTTLLGDELFDYLGHLESEVQKRVSIYKKGSLQYLMHSQMKGIISAEIKFLRYINSNGTQPVLSISPNGLPSVASLKPDLEKMCELKEGFDEIAQRYKESVDGKDEGNLYITVPEEKWHEELKSRKQEKLSSKISFAVSETEEGKFELALREGLYRKGYDQYSKKHPLLMREGKIQYHIIWGKLIEDSKETFYVPNTALVLGGKSTTLAKSKKKNINSTAIKKMGGSVSSSIGGFAKGIIFAPTSLRKIFTTRNCVNERYYHSPTMPDTCAVGGMVGFIGSCLFATIGALVLISAGGPIGAIISGAHYATNLGSGLYEWHRHEKNKLEKESKGE